MGKTKFAVRMLTCAGPLAVMALHGAHSHAQEQSGQATTAASDQELVQDSIVVRGIRQQVQEAADIERSADQVITVITADDLGQFPDETLAESLARVAGVTVIEDEGEGREVVVRGLASDFVQVTVNNAQIGSSDTNGTRSVSLDVIPSELVDEISVGKTLFPDQDHDSFGAKIDLRPLSAFDRSRDSTNRVTVQANYTENAEEVTPNLTGLFTRRFDTPGGELGIAAGIHFSERAVHGDRLQSDSGGGLDDKNFNDENGDTVLPQDIYVPQELDYRLERGERERLGGTLVLDYEWNEDHRVQLSGIYARLRDDDVRVQQEVEIRDANRDETSFLEPGFGTFSDMDIDRQMFFIPTEEVTTALHFEGEHSFSDGDWKLEYAADYSKNDFEIERGLRGQWRERNVVADVMWDEDSASYQILGRGEFDRDNVEEGFFPSGSDFEFGQLLVIEEARDDTIWSANFDVTRRFVAANREFDIKFGGKYRERERNFLRGEDLLSGDDLEDFGFPATLADVPTFSPNSNLDLSGGIPEGALLPEIEFIRTFLGDAADLTGIQPTEDRRDFGADEAITAAYVMGTTQLTPNLKLVAGVRYEQTEYTALGLTDQDFEIDGDDVAGLTFNEVTTYEKTYENFFPGLHLRWDPREDVVVRLGLSRSQVRPSYGDANGLIRADYRFETPEGQVAENLESENPDPNFVPCQGTVPISVGGQQFNVCDDETTDYTIRIRGGNPFLDPIIANQIDFNIGWYPNDDTNITFAAYYKDLEDFIVPVETEDDEIIALLGGEVTDPLTGLQTTRFEQNINAASGELYGIELGVNHFTTYLPGHLEYLFATGNIAIVDGSTSSPAIRDGETIDLPQQSDLLWNLAVGYEDDRLTMRVAAQYIDERLRDLNADDDGRDILDGDRLKIGASARYELNDDLRVYANVSNLTEVRTTRFFRSDELSGRVINRSEDFGRTWRVGLIYNF